VTKLKVAPRFNLTLLHPAKEAYPPKLKIVLHTPDRRMEPGGATEKSNRESVIGERETNGEKSKALPWDPPPVFPQVLRTFRRQEFTKTVVDGQVAVAADHGKRSGVKGHGTAQDMQPPVAKTIDVDRLADQVIRTIDRRIIAHKERLGKV
jgi:hypothetical protein